MTEWIESLSQADKFGLAMLPAAFVLGLVSSAGSACNTPLWLGAIGWGASQKQRSLTRALAAALGFGAGAVLFLAALGVGIGAVGELGGSTFRFYATVVGGLAAVVFGVASLGWLPFGVPTPRFGSRPMPTGFWSSLLFGLAFGGTGMACGVCCGCGPGLAAVLGLAAATRQGIWGGLILTVFGVGYAMPLAAAMIGANFAGSLAVARRAADVVRIAAGGGLVAVGFWTLVTAVC